MPTKLGSYQLFDTVGRGGMADLYVARDGGAGAGRRLVVVKEVRGASPEDVRLRRLLLREAELTGRLSHPNVVRVRHAETTADGAYVVLEYVEGLDLRDLLRIAARRGTWPPLHLALQIVRGLLCGLAHAHRRRDGRGAPLGIVHRDVSPANVLLGFDGQVKLCDFGIASCHEDGLAEVTNVEGKAGYMSPEHARGLTVDPRSDLFAVGIILWELCSARRMYRAKADQTVLEMAQAATVPPLSTQDCPNPARLRAIVERALSPEPADRYPSAQAFLEELRDYVDSSGLASSQRDLAGWLRSSFGQEPAILRRRARERALRGLDRGPALVLRRLTTTWAGQGAADLVESPGVPVEARGPWQAELSTLVVHAVVAAVVAFGLLWALVGIGA